MSYTIADLEDAIENEDTEWEGSWHEFEESVDNTHEYRDVPAHTDGAYFDRYNERWRAKFELDEPGAAIPGIGQAVLVEQFGGEGQGDQLWFVFRVTDADGEDRLFRKSGYYASYDGGEYDGDLDEVVEAQVLTTVYNKL